MTVTTHELVLESLDAMGDVDSLCVFVAEDERPLQGLAGYIDWRLCGALSRVLKGHFFTGVAEDHLLFPVGGRLPMTRLFAVGVGRSRTLHAETLSQVLSSAGKMLSRARIDAVALEIPGAGAVPDDVRALAFTQHFLPAFGGRVALLGEKAMRQSGTSALKG